MNNRLRFFQFGNYSLRTKLVVSFVLVATLPLFIGSTWSLLVLQKTSKVATEHAEGALIEQGEAAISAQAVAVARQIEIYLDTHPEIDMADIAALESNTELAEIAVQSVGQTGYTAVFDKDGVTHFHVNPKNIGLDMSTLADKLPEFWAIFAASLDGSPSDGYYDWEDEDGKIRSKYMYIVPVGETPLRVAATTYIDEFYQPVFGLRSELTNIQKMTFIQILLFAGIVVAVGSGGAYVFGRQLGRPIYLISEAAARAATGDMRPIELEGRSDEIGVLARAYNEMIVKTRDLVDLLERRTQSLATSIAVSHRLAVVTNPRQLTSEVVNEVRDTFDYYYAQIYLLDDAGENLVIAGGTGEAGAAMLARGHSLPVGRGLVGRAADTNASVLIPDVSQEEGWLPNELLPETKAEAAIPISIGNQVLGVLDVQHNLVNGLTQEDVALLESLAGQVAISLRNARSYEQSRKQAELESLVNVIGQKIQRTSSVEDTLQTAVRELGTAIGASRVSASIGTSLQDGGDGASRN